MMKHVSRLCNVIVAGGQVKSFIFAFLVCRDYCFGSLPSSSFLDFHNVFIFQL